MKNYISFVFQGKLQTLHDVRPTDMVLPWLRENRLARGTKEGCNEGDCGACSLVVARPKDGGLEVRPVNACIQPLALLDGAIVLTVEDMAQGDKLHPIQQAVVQEHGTQCGFCTPGFITTMVAGQLSQSPASAETLLAGNLCRCTGYGGLVRAYESQRNTPQPQHIQDALSQAQALLADHTPGGFDIQTEAGRVSAPDNLDDFAALRTDYPDALIVAGATDVGLWITKKLDQPQHIILTRFVRELQRMERDETQLRIGAAVTYAQAESMLLEDYPEAREWFDRLGSMQVRASGTIGGNIANGSPIGDSPPFLIALGATLVLRKGQEQRRIPLEDFFIQYGQQDLAPGEFVEAVEVPCRKPGLRLEVAKISKRFDQDISSLLVALAEQDGTKRYAFGGMAGTPKLASTTMATGNPEDLAQDFQPLSDLRASKEYRMQVAKNLVTAFQAAGETA